MGTLTREEKETANRYRADLLRYRKLLVSDEMLKEHHPELIEAFKMNESSLQQMKESMIKEQKEKMAKYPYLVYCHACNRLKIEPLNPDNTMSFGGDMVQSIVRATEHANYIKSLTDVFSKYLDILSEVYDNEEEIDGVFYHLIDGIVESLGKTENK